MGDFIPFLTLFLLLYSLVQDGNPILVEQVFANKAFRWWAQSCTYLHNQSRWTPL